MRSRWLMTAYSAAMALGLAIAPACGSGPSSDEEDCSVEAQNIHFHDWMKDWYLWSAEMPEVDPLDFEGPKELVSALRAGEDRWSGVSDRETTNDYLENGARVAMGIVYTRLDDDTLTLKQVLLDSPAEAAGLKRGDKIVSISGKTLPEIDAEDVWDDVWGENEAGVEVPLDVLTVDGEMVAVSVAKEELTVKTVPNVETFDRDGTMVGYLMFTSFIEPSEGELDEAFATFKDAGVTELVIDMRYNGGGLLVIAQHLASLIVPAEAIGERMYTAENNENHSDDNWWRDFKELDNAIGAEKVVFITTGRTISASELVINSLKPYMQVGMVGDATGGKPFGMKFVEYCDKLASPVTFRMVNSLGEGHYAAGIPVDCASEDQLDRQLGDPLEDSLATALEVLANDACPAAPSGTIPRSVAPADASMLDRIYPVR